MPGQSVSEEYEKFTSVSWFVLIARLGSSFLLSSECPAPAPCTCSGSSGNNLYIYCDSKSLTDIPQFGTVEAYDSYLNDLYIILQYNSIASIPNYAFRNLSSIKAYRIEININANYKLNVIENNAFVGFENVTTLELIDNNFTALPFAISTLKQLKTLNLLNNPLTTLDHSVIISIAHTLSWLSFDAALFDEWQSELHYLRVLQNLAINKIPYSHLDINTFHGLENILTIITMDHAKLQKVPYAICQLTRLNALSFKFNSNLQENKSSIFEPCRQALPTVAYLYINNNYLRKFPAVFSLFPSLELLSASFNRFEYIESATIPSDSNLTSIYLDNNLFERIPSALNKLKSLMTVYLDNNNIKTIESGDLFGLSKLDTFTITGNPIAYIAPEAFSYNLEMNSLYLQNTQIDHVPEAVIYLTKLNYLYLDGTHIDCSCEMAYLKHWNASGMSYVSGNCASTTDSIQTFVTTTLQSCP